MEHGESGAGLGDARAMTARDAFDQVVQSETAEVVRHLAGAIVVERAAEELRDRRPNVAMPKPARVQREETERLHEGEHAAIPEVEGGGPLRLNEDGMGQGIEVIVTDQAVMAQIFDAQEASGVVRGILQIIAAGLGVVGDRGLS
jgi:hypothetical protein